VGDKWTLLIIRDLVAGPRRFVELQRVLPGISTEQLRSRLNRMVADGLLTRQRYREGLLTRQRYREVPPRVDYELTERARELVPVIAELARWGYAWAWGPPRDGEAIDVGAVFRAAPGLVAGRSGASGLVELRVGERSYWLAVGAGPEAAVLREDAPERAPEATISASEAGWIAALSPDGSRGELAISGDARLADRVLGAISPGAGRTAVRAA
jgi:DNA-binding HxlR family transcriptional regulator